MPSSQHARQPSIITTDDNLESDDDQQPTDDSDDDDDDSDGDQSNGQGTPRLSNSAHLVSPGSPLTGRRLPSARASDLDLRSRLPSRTVLDETTGLLQYSQDRGKSYTEPGTGSRHHFSTKSSQVSLKLPRHHSRASSWGLRIVNALGSARRAGDQEPKGNALMDERVWYDQFTSTDWVHDSIADAFRIRDLRARKGIRGRISVWFDGAQGWILVAIIGVITSCIAYFVNVAESTGFDFKEGYCRQGWYFSKKKCCYEQANCAAWMTWSEHFGLADHIDDVWFDYIIFVFFVILYAVLACLLTLTTRTEIPSTFSLSTLDENLGALEIKKIKKPSLSSNALPSLLGIPPASTMVYYPAAGSGVAEVKVILSGFVVHGYLGIKTLVVKTIALILSVSSGLSLGKEGPYVHIATCVGNIACRLFPKYNHNDAKRREVLSAAAASGVAVAFGAPIGGVLFSLEEVSYYFPAKTLFRTFFCCIIAAMSLKFLNPYGTGKIVIFEVRYLTDWKFFELVVFVILGVMGGALGALFIKASRFWARTFRRVPLIKQWPLLEVVLVALVTGLCSFWNRFTKLAVTELLFEVSTPCKSNATGLCPQKGEQILPMVRYLCVAFVVKALLTVITFGMKVPAGIYVPSMVVGGLMGRIVGHLVQYLVFLYPNASIFGTCQKEGGFVNCVTPGVYALVAAGATMCGVTRLSVTLAVILFELTGSLDHVLPFSLSILVAKWTADALEPLSIYDLLTDMNSYPLLDNKIRPIFTNDLADITPKFRSHRVIDLSHSPLVPASKLRRKLQHLHKVGELDGGLPILRAGVLIGLIPAPDLEFALDKLEDEDQALCLMAPNLAWSDHGPVRPSNPGQNEDTGLPLIESDPTDFTPYIDPAPVALDIHSPMDLVFQCFVKLGLRYICVLREGVFAGLVHKKSFVRYVKELERNGGNMN